MKFFSSKIRKIHVLYISPEGLEWVNWCNLHERRMIIFFMYKTREKTCQQQKHNKKIEHPDQDNSAKKKEIQDGAWFLRSLLLTMGFLTVY